MDKTKQWGLAAGVGVLAVLVVGWFLLISPQRSNASDLRTQTDTQQSVNEQLQQQINMLKAQHKGLPQVQAELAKLAVQLPDNPGLPALIRQLSNAADSAGVDLIALTPSPPQFVTKAPTAASSTATSATAGTETAPSTVAPTATSSSQLAYVPIQVVINGGYFNVAQFISNLEANKRSFLVTQIDAGPKEPRSPSAAGGTSAAAGTDTGSTGAAYTGHLEATITGRVFMNVPPAAAATAPSSQSTAPTTAK